VFVCVFVCVCLCVCVCVCTSCHILSLLGNAMPKNHSFAQILKLKKIQPLQITGGCMYSREKTPDDERMSLET
jgi:hypothetical protein